MTRSYSQQVTKTSSWNSFSRTPSMSADQNSALIWSRLTLSTSRSQKPSTALSCPSRPVSSLKFAGSSTSLMRLYPFRRCQASCSFQLSRMQALVQSNSAKMMGWLLSARRTSKLTMRTVWLSSSHYATWTCSTRQHRWLATRDCACMVTSPSSLNTKLKTWVYLSTTWLRRSVTTNDALSLSIKLTRSLDD